MRGENMSAKLNIRPEVAERLATAANERGLSVEALLGTLLDEAHALPVRPPRATFEEFKATLDALAEGSESRPVLTDSATTRKGIYADHD
jgi:hypothetical protein